MSSVAQLRKVVELPRIAPAFAETLSRFPLTITQYSMLCSSQTDGYFKFGCHTSSVMSEEQVKAIRYLKKAGLIKLDYSYHAWQTTEVGKRFLKVIGDLIDIPDDWPHEGKLLPWKK